LSIGDIIRSAFGNLMRRKARTFLTVGGIAIGIASLTLIVAMVTSARDYINAQADAFLAPNTVLVVSEQRGDFMESFIGLSVGQPPQEVNKANIDITGIMRPPQSLRPAQVEALQALPDTTSVYPQVLVSANSIELDGATEAYTVQLRTFYPEDNIELVVGRQVQDALPEAILAYQYMEVFGWSQPEEALGQEVVLTLSRFDLGTLAIETETFRASIVGITTETLAATAVYVPYEYAMELSRWQLNESDLYTTEKYGPFALLYTADIKQAGEVAKQVEDLGMGASTQRDIIGMLDDMFLYIEGILGLFGFIALVVASLGVANTMIMAVYERTKEIGILKAIGARGSTIRTLYSMEAGFNGFIGALLGTAIAWVGGMLINVFAGQAFGLAGFSFTSFPYWLIIGAILFGTVLALIAGILPANRAANLDPIMALRHD
jgi:putative ABC transport system permease protein